MLSKHNQTLVVAASEATGDGPKDVFVHLRRNAGAEYVVLTVTPGLGNREPAKAVFIPVGAAKKLAKALARMLED
jgi:hypothetical protein